MMACSMMSTMMSGPVVTSTQEGSLLKDMGGGGGEEEETHLGGQDQTFYLERLFFPPGLLTMQGTMDFTMYSHFGLEYTEKFYILSSEVGAYKNVCLLWLGRKFATTKYRRSPQPALHYRWDNTFMLLLLGGAPL